MGKTETKFLLTILPTRDVPNIRVSVPNIRVTDPNFRVTDPNIRVNKQNIWMRDEKILIMKILNQKK